MSVDKYTHSEVEDKIYSYWQKNNLFKPKQNKKKFSIVIPPPNVTGSLHMGHALNNSIQDLLKAMNTQERESEEDGNEKLEVNDLMTRLMAGDTLSTEELMALQRN